MPQNFMLPQARGVSFSSLSLPTACALTQQKAISKTRQLVPENTDNEAESKAHESRRQ